MEQDPDSQRGPGQQDDPAWPHDPDHLRDWDAGDLGCGDLVIRLRFLLKAMAPGEVIRVRATDSGARHDVPAWCRMTGETLVHHDLARHLYWIRRGG